MPPGAPTPRLRALAERAVRGALWRLGARVPSATGLHMPDTSFRRLADPGVLASEERPVTDGLYGRLGEEDVAAVAARVVEEPGARALLDPATATDVRRFLTLAYGIWLDVPGVAAKTGLPLAQPPEDVHAMARGPHAAAGGLYEADLVAAALQSAGVAIAQSGRALDFGCSSGRVVRALAAMYPEVSWLGCDPNRPAIEWAAANLPPVEFFVNGSAPPLPLEGSSLGLLYAISIWSHFEPGLGLRWFEEARRVLRPGGMLVMTTHGVSSIAYYVEKRLRTPAQALEIAAALYRRGWWYANEFGAKGDWGVVDPDWGTAFLSPEWVLAQLCPRWRVLEYVPGRNQGNQDVYVLERV